MIPEKWRPHAYQKRAIEFGVQQACAGFFFDPGLGKTALMLAIYKFVRKYVGRMLVVAPLRVCHSVWPNEAKKWTDFKDLKVYVLHGPKKAEILAQAKRDADVMVINPEGLDWLVRHKMADLGLGMLTVDECFPAGTLVDTYAGRHPIEALRPGDLVHTSAGLRRVLKLGTRQVSRLVRLHLSNGGTLECTPEHPVFTDAGWVPAWLCQGRKVYARSDMPALREEISSGGEDDPARRAAEVLLQILCSEADVGRDAPGSISADEGPYVEGRAGKEGVEQGAIMACRSPEDDLRVGEAERQGLQGERRERDGDDGVRGEGQEDFAERVAVELRGRVGWEAARLSHMLQARLRAPRQEVGTGSGRGESSTDGPAGAGSEKGEDPTGVRVARVQDLERRDTQVFNLTVEGCPHFFAEGVLVHNCTKFKHSNTQRFRTLKSILDQFKRRYILTGSPAPNGLLDLFGQVYILDGGAALGRYVTHYRMEYFHNPVTGTQYDKYKWLPKPDAAERIYKKLRPLVVRGSAADYLELPELIENKVEVTLPDAAKKQYDQMEAVMMTALESDEMVVAANAAAATTKCRQIANGGIYHDDGEKWSHIHEAKADAVEDLVEELSGKPALVAYEYRHDLDRLRRRFGSDVPYIGGGVPTSAFRDIERRWNAGEIPVLLAQPQSVAHGLNLQGTGAAVIWHSLTWDLEIYEQFVRRVWRQGQRERVVVHHVVAKDTVDEVIMKMLHAKDKTQRALLAALKTHLKGKS